VSRSISLFTPRKVERELLCWLHILGSTSFCPGVYIQVEESEVVVSLNPSIVKAMEEKSTQDILDVVTKIEQQARRICPKGKVTLLGLSGHKNYLARRIHQVNIELRRTWKSSVLSPTGWLGPKLVWDNDKQDWENRCALVEMGKLIERAVLRSEY
jgi:hypothetical protein